MSLHRYRVLEGREHIWALLMMDKYNREDRLDEAIMFAHNSPIPPPTTILHTCFHHGEHFQIIVQAKSAKIKSGKMTNSGMLLAAAMLA